MIDAEDIDQLLDQLQAFPQRLRDMIVGFDDETLKRAAPNGGWGAVEIYCHLRDVEEIFIERLSRTLTEDEPFLPAVDETLWPIEREYDRQDPRIALEQFAKNRAQFVSILSKLDEANWRRRGHHAEEGDQTVLRQAQYAAEHDVDHEQQLKALLRVS